MTDATTSTAAGTDPAPPWVVVRPAGPPTGRERLPRLRSVLLLVGAAALVVIVAVAVAGALISRRAAEREAVRDAAELTNVLADSAVQPALTDTMAASDIRISTAAAATLAPVVRQRVLPAASVVRIKLWTPQGRILYSDEPRLVGRIFGLDTDARSALTDPQVSAEISDLDEPENRYERGRGTLLEVHRPVYTPAGRPLLFEVYYRYDQVTDRANAIWRGFVGITLGSIGLLVLLLVPLAAALVLRTRRAQRLREESLRRSADASLDERRRLAATLHDGVMQELVAASFAVGVEAQDAQARGATEQAERLVAARDAVRAGIGGMRSLLVDLYPPNLHDAGLRAALADLVAGLRQDGTTAVEVVVSDEACELLDPGQTEMIFRMVQEMLRNAAAHARAGSLVVTLDRVADDVVLEVVDDGVGFDPAVRPAGHFGLALLTDLAAEHGAELALRTAPGAGTAWRVRIPAGSVS